MTVLQGVGRSRGAWAPSNGFSLMVCAMVAALCLAASPGSAQEEEADAVDGVDGMEAVEVAEPTPSVVAQFTTGVENREPVDQITFVRNEVEKVFFFSDLRGLTGESVVHRWIYDGETVAEVRFEVRGPRWRVWSSKDLMPDWIGDWTVEIVRMGASDGDAEGRGEPDDGGEVIAAETFTYSAPDA